MTDLTDQLDAIQARVDAATEGPWRTWKDDGGRRGSAVETAWAHDADGADTELITDWCSPADAEFIAAAPDDVAFLLVLARKQQAAIDAVKALMESKQFIYDAVCENTCSKGTHGIDHEAIAERVVNGLTKALEAKP